MKIGDYILMDDKLAKVVGFGIEVEKKQLENGRIWEGTKSKYIARNEDGNEKCFYGYDIGKSVKIVKKSKKFEDCTLEEYVETIKQDG